MFPMSSIEAMDAKLAALTQLHLAAREMKQMETWLERDVRAARQAGISWGMIGEALGLSRQGAWERFHRCGPHIP